MDVYLDDVIIYSDTLPNHISHVKTVIDVLRREKLYLGAEKRAMFVTFVHKLPGSSPLIQGVQSSVTFEMIAMFKVE